MKQRLLGIAAALLCGFSASAQCTPDPNGNQLIIPDLSQINYQMTVGQPFDETVTINVPSDTTVNVGPISFTGNVDSVVLEGVNGMPPGISYECNPTSCVWLGGERGCVRLFGTPTQAGTFSATIDATAYVTDPITSSQQMVDVPADPFDMVVDGTTSIGNLTLARSERGVMNYPNPVTGETYFLFASPVIEQVTLHVFNVMGEVVYQEVFTSNAGENRKAWDASGLAPGAYFYTLRSASLQASSRLVVSE